MKNGAAGAGVLWRALPVLVAAVGFWAGGVAGAGITVSPLELEPFVPLAVGYLMQPAEQTITITNGGGAAVNLKLEFINVSPSLGFKCGTDKTSLQLAGGATTTFTVSPLSGLGVGVYTATLKVAGGGDVGVEYIDLFFEVMEKAPYRITLTSTFKDFGSWSPNGEQPGLYTIFVYNTGTRPVTLEMPESAWFDIDLKRGNLPTDAMVSFTVRPKAGLPPREAPYVDGITIVGRGDGGSAPPVTVTAKFVMEAGVNYGIDASPQFLSFGTKTFSAGRPYDVFADTPAVTVTNVAEAPDTILTVLAGPLGYFEIARGLTAGEKALPVRGATATFTLRPAAGLPEGEYSDIITITTFGRAVATVVATFVVKEVEDGGKDPVDPPVPPDSTTGGEPGVPQRPVVLISEVVVGPNPAPRSSGGVSFYRSGVAVAGAELFVYDAIGNAVGKVRISDEPGVTSYAKRKVGRWDLRDRYGRLLPEATYLVRGVVKINGKREKIAIPLAIAP